MASEEGIEFRLRWPKQSANRDGKNILLAVLNAEEAGTEPAWLEKVATPEQAIVFCEPRGIGETRWTRKNGPNYVERSHALLGRTVDTGRVWDVIAAAKYLREWQDAAGVGAGEISVAGSGAGGVLAAYAAVLEPKIGAITVVEPPLSHMEKGAPQFLNVLRVCDVPQALGLLAPRPLNVMSEDAAALDSTSAAYRGAGTGQRLRIDR